MRAGVVASLEWEKTTGSKVILGQISLGLYYKGDRYKFFRLALYAVLGEKIPGEDSRVINGRYKEKAFNLNPNPRMQQDVDNLLLTFTGELLDAHFL